MPTDRLNRPLHDLRLSVIDACNFRCQYCMPLAKFPALHPFLKRAEWLTRAEIQRLVAAFVELGVRKVRLTGGEPLLRPDLADIVSDLAAMEGVEDLAMVTNASHLARHADRLRDAGLHRLTVSLDALDDATLSRINGTQTEIQPILDGVSAAEAAGFGPIKFNAVVIRHVNDHAILDLARFARERGHVMRFIEYMDVGTLNDWGPEHVVPGTEIAAQIGAVYPLEPIEAAYHGEVAARYRYLDGGGEIGLITSVSQPFCGSCTRARVSADGRLYTCLFAADGLDLRTPLRAGASDEELLAIITRAWRRREDRYSELRNEATSHNPRVEMYQIGG